MLRKDARTRTTRKITGQQRRWLLCHSKGPILRTLFSFRRPKFLQRGIYNIFYDRMCELAKLLAFLRSAATLACVLETFKMFGIQSFKTERGGKFTSVCHTCCTIHEESNLVSPTALSSLLWSKCLSSERLLTPGILVVYFQRVRFQVMTSCQVMSQWEFFTDLLSIRSSLLSAVHPSSIRTSVNHDEISQEWVSEWRTS